MRPPLAARLAGARGDPLDLARAQLIRRRRLALRLGLAQLRGLGRQRGRGDGDRRQGGDEAREPPPPNQGRASRRPKLHILFPMKLSGVAITIEAA